MRFFTSLGTLLFLLIAGFACILGSAAGALFHSGNRKSNTLPRVSGA